MKTIIIWTLVVFILTTLATMQLMGSSDGVDKIGFPFTFYDRFGGKCDDCYKTFGFKWPNLFIDVGLTTLPVALITTLFKKLTNTKP